MQGFSVDGKESRHLSMMSPCVRWIFALGIRLVSSQTLPSSFSRSILEDRARAKVKREAAKVISLRSIVAVPYSFGSMVA